MSTCTKLHRESTHDGPPGIESWLGVVTSLHFNEKRIYDESGKIDYGAQESASAPLGLRDELFHNKNSAEIKCKFC